MEFKQAKVATAPASAGVSSALTAPVEKGKAAQTPAISPTTQSIADTFAFVASKGATPAFDPASDPLRALRAAINATGGISPQVEIPTIEQILKEVDPTGNSLVDGTLEQQYEDLKLIYTTEKLALEDKVARGIATAQDVKDLKKSTEVITELNTQIDAIAKHYPVQMALYQQEIDAVRAFGIKHAEEKYHTINENAIALYDLNGDGKIGSPLAGSALYTDVVIGAQTIDGTESYAFLDGTTLRPAQFDAVTGEMLASGVQNAQYQWDLTSSGLTTSMIHPNEIDAAGIEGLDVTFNPIGNFLGPRKASADAQGTYNTQIDIPMPESFWIKKYPDGSDIEHDVEGGMKTETYVEGITDGVMAAPPHDIREDYRQVQVAEVEVTSVDRTLDHSEDITVSAGAHLITFRDADGRILLRMRINGLWNPSALGELGKRLMPPAKEPGISPSGIPASSFAMTLSAGYHLGDPNKMRKSPIKLTVDSNFVSTTNGGVYEKNGVSVPKDHLKQLKTTAVGGTVTERNPEYDTLAHFTNAATSARYVGPKSLTTTAKKSSGAMPYTSAGYAEHGKGAEFLLDEANGPMAMGLSGNLKMGNYNAVVEEGKRPKNVDHLDPQWTSLVDMGGGYGLFLGQNGDHHVRNATQVYINGDDGDQNYLHVKSQLEWDALRAEVQYSDAPANFYQPTEVTKYKDNPAVFVKVAGGKTYIDNEDETGSVTDAYDYFDSMTKEGPGGSKTESTNLKEYNDDKYLVSKGDVIFTNTVDQYDLPANASKTTAAFDSDAILLAYTEAEKTFEEFLRKDPTVVSEGELLEGEAAWEVYGPNYAEAQESVSGFFSEYKNQFGSSVPMDAALDPAPEKDLDHIEKDLEKKMGSNV